MTPRHSGLPSRPHGSPIQDPELRWLSYRLLAWAESRERRNPFGHGKTETALLRSAAREIDRLLDALREIERYPVGDGGYQDVAREGLRV